MGDLAWVGVLPPLETLYLGHSPGSPVQVESLAPLRGHASLRAITLEGIRSKDGSLRAFERAAALRQLSLPWSYPFEEYARLRVARPDLDCLDLVPHEEPELGPGGTGTVMVNGYRSRWAQAAERPGATRAREAAMGA